MRFSFLVAVEIFFLSIICVGCDACRGIEDVAIELKNFFLQNGNIIKSEEFKCRKDSPSGLLLNANININGEINLEYKLLLCLEEFMYFFRSLFEDKIKVKQGEEELFYNFCRYVAKIIDTENIENGNKQERQLAVLFLNLCKLFFTDNREKNSLETAYNLMEDVRDFLIVSEEVFNIKKCGDSGNQEEHFCVVFINCVWAFLERFVERENGKILVKKTLPDRQHTITEDNLNKNTYLTKLQPELLKIDEQNSIIDSLFSEVQVEPLGNKNAVLPPIKKPKETFFLKNFSPAKVFFKKTKGQCTVLIYDDFVVFEDTKSREEIVWKRERRNRATPYSFYRLLFENEIRESDIFAKNSEKKVIDILENEIKAQMLYDFKILCSHITEFISWFKEQEKVAFESILRDFVRPVIATYLRGNTDNFVKSKLEIDDIEEKIKSYFTLKEQRRGRYVVCPSEACVKIFEKDCTLTEELWLFLSLVAQGVYEGISIKIKEKRDFFFKSHGLKG